MPKSTKPLTYDEWVAQLPPGVEDRPAVWRDDADRAETLAALEEYRRTGEAVDAGPVLDAFVASVRRRVTKGP